MSLSLVRLLASKLDLRRANATIPGIKGNGNTGNTISIYIGSETRNKPDRGRFVAVLQDTIPCLMHISKGLDSKVSHSDLLRSWLY